MNEVKTKLSAVVITKNEEKRIGECLESVKWADEIIVVDDGSTDRTVEIAGKYTDKIFQHGMSNEGAHRNYAYSLASNEWVLSIDADERVSPGLREEISETLGKGTDCNGFTIPRKNYIGDFWLANGGWYPSAQLRLFRRNEFKYEEVDVHPRAFMKDPRGELKNPIIHHSYRDLEDFMAKQNNQTTRESGKWSGSEKGMPLSRAVRRSIDRYLRAYHRKRGKEDGLYGFIMAVLGGFYQILSYAKYWESGLGLKDNRGLYPVPGSKGVKTSEKPPLSGRMKLSVVILARNEEDKIADCLESIKWVDEIVVVDGFSTDATADICEKYGAKIVRHKFEGDFGQERNIGNDNASGDWILQLDADEVVTEGFKKAVIGILKNNENDHAAYKFLRKNFFMGHFMRYGGWYHYSHHFFRKGYARYDGRVHHQLVVDGKTGIIDEDIEHNPFKSFEQIIDRQNRYTTLEAREILDLRGRVDDKEIEYNIRVKPFKLFRKFYIKKMGFREGVRGLLFSVIFAWTHFIKWAKYWEMVSVEKTEGGGQEADS